MNIKHILFGLFFLLSFGAFAQTKKVAPAVPTPPSNEHLKLFDQAVVSGDVGTAIIALNYYVSSQGKNSVYEDTLAMLYMQQGSYPQCYYWADKRLQLKPDDNNLLELKGVCLDKLQQPKEAIEVFEKLFRRTQSPYHGYKLMELQYSIKRLAECLATSIATEKLTFKPEFTMTYNVGQQVGRTYLQAGVFNIHALALYDLDKKAEAKSYFERALALDTTFLLAKQNLEAMRTLEVSGKGKQAADNNATPSSPGNKQN